MNMLTRSAAVWAAVSGLVGTCMLIVSFAINNGPPAGASGAQLTAFGQQHFDEILWGAWLQAVGPVFIVLFAFTIVLLAGAAARLAGWMTLFGAATLMTVSLVEIVGYIGALHTSPATMAEISYALIHSVQHLYFIVAAPALFLPLGGAAPRDRFLVRDHRVRAADPGTGPGVSRIGARDFTGATSIPDGDAGTRCLSSLEEQ